MQTRGRPRIPPPVGGGLRTSKRTTRRTSSAHADRLAVPDGRTFDPRPPLVVTFSAFATRMSWHDLLFAHWAVDAAALRALLPSVLELDRFDGQAYLGVVPFRMTRMGPRILPPIPGLSSFPEINVRTYVVRDGRPGVWFFSLDATKRLAVWAARRFFNLPYFDADILCRRDGDAVEYRSERTRANAPPARFAARYAPTGDAAHARPGSIDHWFAERYCLYSVPGDGRPRRVDIVHRPWPLAPATAKIEENTMASSLGFELSGPPAFLHFARRLDVVSKPPVLA